MALVVGLTVSACGGRPQGGGDPGGTVVDATGPSGGSPQGPSGANPQGPSGENPQGPSGENPQGPSGENPQGPSGGNPQGPSGGAAGAPINRNNGAVAAGAPFKMPAFQQRGAGNIDELEEQIRAAIRDGCPNNELCVATVRQPLAALEGQTYHPSCFLGTDPDTSEEIELNPQKTRVLTIYHGTDDSQEPCPRQDTGSGGTDSTDTTDTTGTTAQPTDPTESTDSTQSDDSQSQPPSSS
jgi:hypothetical protein